MSPTSSPPVAVIYGLLLSMGVMWGLTLSLAKIAVAEGGHPLGLGLWQVAVSASLMLLIILCKRQRIGFRQGLVRFGLICGLFGVSFPAYALFMSARYLPAGIMAIAFASMPMLTYLFSIVFGLERIRVRRVLGVMVGLGAILLMVLPESALPDARMVPWVLLALLASVSMSFENYYIEARGPAVLNAVQLAFGRQFGAVVILSPLVMITGTGIPVMAEWGTLQYVATLNGFLAGFAFAMLLFVIRVAGAVFASQAAYVITLAGVGWGMILFGESHSIYIWVTLILTLMAIYLVQPRSDETARQSGSVLRSAEKPSSSVNSS